MLGVTGPNEYENNVDNNWYTNYIARWCLQYAASCIENTRGNHDEIISRTGLSAQEVSKWSEIASNIHLPQNEELGIFLQQDNYLNKEQLTVDQIPDGQRPINQNWSWDRILRSCFIKQADVLQGLFFFSDDFDEGQMRRNFEFYEPRTVHESSLSPCVHSILASWLSMPEKAYEMYLRTSRLDLEDYNNDTDEGLHITSMAGTWMSIVKGFAGVKLVDEKLAIRPFMPSHWQSMTFHMHFRSNLFKIHIDHTGISVYNTNGPTATLDIQGQLVELAPGMQHLVELNQTLTQ